MPRLSHQHNGPVPEAKCAAALVTGAGEMGWDLRPRQVEMLLAYVSLLSAWNAVHNLSAVRRSEDSVTRNVLDSLAIVQPLVHFARSTGAHCILDAGTGAGLPAVVLALMRPDWTVFAVDAVAKKIAFVRQVAGQLGLANLRPRHARLEHLVCEPVDVVTSRALGSLSVLVAHTRHLLKPEGVWVAMKGRRPEDEIAALPEGVGMFHVEQLQIPGVAAERCLVWLRQTENPNE